VPRLTESLERRLQRNPFRATSVSRPFCHCHGLTRLVGRAAPNRKKPHRKESNRWGLLGAGRGVDVLPAGFALLPWSKRTDVWIIGFDVLRFGTASSVRRFTTYHPRLRGAYRSAQPKRRIPFRSYRGRQIPEKLVGLVRLPLRPFSAERQANSAAVAFPHLPDAERAVEISSAVPTGHLHTAPHPG
jgi:hypothetical protein